MTTFLRRFSILLLLSMAILYCYRISLTLTGVLLSALAALLLSLVGRSLFSRLDHAAAEQESTEHNFSFSGWQMRAFVDTHCQIWLRARDLQHYLGHTHTDRTLAQRFPSHFRKANPAIDAWYIQPAALQTLHAEHYTESAARLLSWLTREVVGPLQAEAGLAVAPASPVVLRRAARKSWLGASIGLLMQIKRGQASLPVTLLGGGLLVAFVIWLSGCIQLSGDITLHYRGYALAYVAQITLAVVAVYYWGRSILIAAQRWVIAERSLLVALFAGLIGFGSVLYAAQQVVDREKQYLLTDFFTLLFDIDETPRLSYDDASHRITLRGPLGFGTSSQFNALLAQHPDATGVELDSPGGRVAEGFALVRTVLDTPLDTWVRAECVSACVYIFTAGTNRYVAPSAFFGLHRAGMHWQTTDDGMSEADQLFIDLLHMRSVDEDFITRGLTPSIHGLYEPSTKEVLAAGLGTEVWNP